MIRIAPRLLLGLLMGLALSAQAPTLIRAGRLLDVRTGQLRSDQGLLVKDGRIAANGPEFSQMIFGTWRLLDAPALSAQKSIDLGLLGIHLFC